MRPFLALLPLALLLTGCAAPPTQPAPSSPPASPSPSAGLANATACVEGLAFEDARDLPTGGSGEDSFELVGSCSLFFDLEVTRMAGNLEVTVEGPNGVAFHYDRFGVEGPGASVSASGDQSNRGGPSAQGTYTYSFSADTTAAFAFRARTSAG